MGNVLFMAAPRAGLSVINECNASGWPDFQNSEGTAIWGHLVWDKEPRPFTSMAAKAFLPSESRMVDSDTERETLAGSLGNSDVSRTGSNSLC